VKAWEAMHGLGAAWGNEENRANVRVFEVAPTSPARPSPLAFATASVSTVQPKTGALWCTTNERDMLGDNLVPDYSTTVKEGGYYGWPWYYMGNNEEPRLRAIVRISRARHSSGCAVPGALRGAQPHFL